MKELSSYLLSLLLILLCGCSDNDLMDTYWRDNKTGEWLIGLANEKVVYDCKVWDIATIKDNDGICTIQAECGTEKLDISFGNQQDGKCTISVNGNKAECSIIDGRFLPDYPEKDACDTIADNHYAEGDSVTIMGWIKPRSSIVKWLHKPTGNQEVSAQTTDIYTDQYQTFKTKTDSIGCFTLRIPIANTTSFYLKTGSEMITIVAEPNETYFLMIDPSEDKTLFMGRNARLQNEVNAHSIDVEQHNTSQINGESDMMVYFDYVYKKTIDQLKQLDETCQQHPTLSKRYKTFQTNKIWVVNANHLMQSRSKMSDFRVPEAFLNAVGKHYASHIQEPYTLIGSEFTSFFRDYCQELEFEVNNKSIFKLKPMMQSAVSAGVLYPTAKEWAAADQYDAAYTQLHKKLMNTPDSLRKPLIEAFNNSDFTKVISEMIRRNPDYENYANSKFDINNIELNMQELNVCGWPQNAQDLYLCRRICITIANVYTPIYKPILDFAVERVHMPAAANAMRATNLKYEQIAQQVLSNDNLKSNDVVKGMTDGEQILKKLIEPYKGRIVILDIWGTWCGPCKERLSHSQEEYERLKHLDIVYLYLANNSKDESWKNVIKAYNLTGPNVAHYNLPAEQQKAVENFLRVKGFPTYKLIDKQGNIHDLDWLHANDLDAFAKQLERMK